MLFYKNFQTVIQSDLAFPQLNLLSEDLAGDEPIIRIQLGNVKKRGLDQALTKFQFSQLSEQELWLNIPPIGRFLIKNGCQIVVHPLKNKDEDSLREVILSFCFKALLAQQGFFIIAATAIKIGDRCFLIAGPSGVGKSTLAAAFLKRGYCILSDGFCAITKEGQVNSSYPVLKLWKDAAMALDINTDPLIPIRPNLKKFQLPLKEQFYSGSLAFNAIYLIQVEQKEDYGVEKIEGFKKITYFQQLLQSSKLLQSTAQQASVVHATNFAQQCAVVNITRPEETFKLEEGVELIENDLKSRGLWHE